MKGVYKIKIHVEGVENNDILKSIADELKIDILQKQGFEGWQELLTIFVLQAVKTASQKATEKLISLFKKIKELYSSQETSTKTILITIEDEDNNIVYKDNIEIAQLEQLPDIIKNKIEKN